MNRTLEIADLFCGAGGTSTGAVAAARDLGYEPRLTAVNHWPVAVATHAANHPGARHVCASVDSINPRHLFPSGKLDILWASPECTHHSRARGGRPMSDQSRASGHCVTRWAEALQPDLILVENVQEFLEWGPIGRRGRPLKSKRGATFRAWITMLESLGYRVEWRILCAADYGDPTTRKRLFVQAARGNVSIYWPTPSHSAKPTGDRALPRWASARSIIDWSLPSSSIFTRKKPLAANTLRRIFAGLRRNGLRVGEAFMVQFHGTSDAQIRATAIPVDQPVPTISAGGVHTGIVQPFLVQVAHRSCLSQGRTRSVEDPLPVVCGHRGDMALCEPALLPQQSDGRLRPVDEPCPTVSTAGAIALVEPFLVEYYGTGGVESVDNPLPTATTKPRFGLAQPEVVIDGTRYRLDVRFRMLQPHELAGAQGFPVGYQFSGNKTDVVRQIGNAVPCGLARALVSAALSKGGIR